MAGKVGQYEHTDDLGQVHGTWGIAIHPSTDTFVEITAEEAAAIRASRAAANAIVKSGFGKGETHGTMQYRGGKVALTAKVDFTASRRGVFGVREIDCPSVYRMVEHITGIKNVAVEIRIEPIDVRKTFQDLGTMVSDAVKLAMRK